MHVMRLALANAVLGADAATILRDPLEDPWLQSIQKPVIPATQVSDIEMQIGISEVTISSSSRVAEALFLQHAPCVLHKLVHLVKRQRHVVLVDVAHDCHRVADALTQAPDGLHLLDVCSHNAIMYCGILALFAAHRYLKELVQLLLVMVLVGARGLDENIKRMLLQRILDTVLRLALDDKVQCTTVTKFNSREHL